MKLLTLYISLFYLIGCNLFQGQQPAEESAIVEEKQEEVFVPVQKEMYVINPTAMQYTEPDIHTEPKDRLNSFGDLLEIEAESEHFYKIKSNWNWYLRKDDMGNYEDIRFKESLEDVYLIGKKQEDGTIEEEKGITLSKYFTIDFSRRISKSKEKWIFSFSEGYSFY